MLGTGVIVVYQESYSRQALGAGFLDGIVNQGSGYALAAESLGYTEAIDVEFASLRLVVHRAMVHS